MHKINYHEQFYHIRKNNRVCYLHYAELHAPHTSIQKLDRDNVTFKTTLIHFPHSKIEKAQRKTFESSFLWKGSKIVERNIFTQIKLIFFNSVSVCVCGNVHKIKFHQKSRRFFQRICFMFAFFVPGSGIVILYDCDGLCMALTLTMIQKLTVR